MVLKTIETIETIFKLAGETKPQEKNKAQEKTIKELFLLSLLSLKKTPRAEIRIIAIVFLKTARSES